MPDVNPDITIEKLTGADIPALVEIEKQEFSTPWDEDMFRQEVDNPSISRSYVAVADGVVVGYFVAWFFGDRVHLLNIAVSSPYKRRGIGSALLRFLIKAAVEDGKKVITLEVREGNKGAIAFYVAFDFEIIGKKEGYYVENNEDAILMALWLDEAGPDRTVKKRAGR